MYTEAGYIDFDYIMKDPNVFKFIIGGRGSGKTYGAIKWALDNGKTMMFMRRTQTPTVKTLLLYDTQTHYYDSINYITKLPKAS